jgi:NmrA-like family
MRPSPPGAEHLVYASVAGADRATGAAAFDSKREIEQYIRRSGMPATILRPVSFMDNYADPARYLGAAVAIAGDELTPPQTAQALSRATGQHIRHVQIPVEAVRQHNSDLADAVSYLNSHGGYGADIAAARALHRGLRTFGAWLAEPGRARLAALLGSSRVATRLSARSRHERRRHHRDHRRQLAAAWPTARPW